MFDAPLDVWYVWLALCGISLAVASLVVAFPTSAPPHAAGVADAVDSVATSQYRTFDTVSLDAEEIRLRARQIALRSDGGTANARFAFGPVTPARTDPLEAVLGGDPPSEVFASREAFESALEAAREQPDRWRPAAEQLAIRHVSWGDVDATIVG